MCIRDRKEITGLGLQKAKTGIEAASTVSNAFEVAKAAAAAAAADGSSPGAPTIRALAKTGMVWKQVGGVWKRVPKK